MKKQLMLALAACGLSSVVVAGGLPVDTVIGNPATSDAGVYFGLAAGYGHNDVMQDRHSLDGTEARSHGNFTKENGLMGRVFAGYDLNRHFAIETGYSHFFTKVKAEKSENSNPADYYKLDRTHVVDVMGKIKAPICEGFDLYAKVGGNYFMGERNHFNVAYGAGIDWSITSNIVAGLEWMRFNGCGKCKVVLNTEKNSVQVVDKVRHADAFMATVRYKFDI